jgi:dipeptidyl aminopeptidase/acylaminoacyl peptidase
MALTIILHRQPDICKNLKKLMLAHGMMDNNVPPYNTMLEATLTKQQGYDLVIFPNAGHGYGPLL